MTKMFYVNVLSFSIRLIYFFWSFSYQFLAYSESRMLPLGTTMILLPKNIVTKENLTETYLMMTMNCKNSRNFSLYWFPWSVWCGVSSRCFVFKRENKKGVFLCCTANFIKGYFYCLYRNWPNSYRSYRNINTFISATSDYFQKNLKVNVCSQGK